MDGLISKIAEWLKYRLGLVRYVRIYCYVVRVSGIVLPPVPLRKKSDWQYLTSESPIKFELSFEETPFFRTVIADWKEAQKRYDGELRELVKNEERKAGEAPIGSTPFAWFIKADASLLPVRKLEEFLAVADPEQKKEYQRTGKIMVAARPEYVIMAMDFEPVESFEVRSEKIRQFEAIDTYFFKLYRPDEDEPYRQYTGEFLHKLG